MFQLGKTIVSEDLIEKDFVCNLSALQRRVLVVSTALRVPLLEEEEATYFRRDLSEH